MTTKINADANGLTETVDTSGILEIQTNGTAAVIIGVDQNANFTSTGAITVPAGTTAQRPTPVNGMMRYNSNVAVFEVYANNSWAAANVTPAPTNTVAPVISGSAVVGQNLTCTTGTWSGSPSAYFYQWRANSTAISNATANVFTLTSTQTGANITCNVIAQNIAGNSSPATSNSLGPVVLGTTVNYLIVAGGGGGGFAMGGGGGAGGFQTGTTILQPANTYSITIGAGGVGASSTGTSGVNGSNSSISGLTASVGGGGGGSQVSNGVTGGSGGGAGSGSGRTAGSGTSGQGNAGGLGAGLDSGSRGAGGGGGASAAGGVGTSTTGGNGGAGTASSITGSSVTYAGGGGGGCGRSTGTPGTGGAGGGGSGTNDGSNATNGTANTGGGGGGGGESSGFVDGIPGTGGSGIVIISYAGAQQFGGGVITTDGSNTIHTFYTSGSLVPLTALSANYLVVAGGGGGGSTFGGGGGAGGLLSGSNVTIDSSSIYPITVGAGGAAGSSSSVNGLQGGNSTWSMITTIAVGGGGGVSGYSQSYTGKNGGSGGGGSGNDSYAFTLGGTGTAGQGYAGGNGNSTNRLPSGGGGGSAQAGGNATSTVAGFGGNGTSSSISGTATYYAGGGGGDGGLSGGTAGTGGLGGGGNGSLYNGVATSGTAATGGGGGGGGTAGAGGSGVVIISYPGSTPMMAGGNVTVVSNTVVHTFTSSGYLTPFVNMNNSLRWRRSATAYLGKTYTNAPTSRTTMTFSAWVKRGLLSAQMALFGTSNNYESAYFNSSDQLYVGGPYMSGQQGSLTTSQVFRDPAAWYHIVVVFDTTNATAANRLRLFVNGTQVTAFASSTNSNQNNTTTEWLNTNILNMLGTTGASGTGNPFDGYMTEINVIDGQALSPYAFGNFNQYGVWAPVRYAGSYGTNGFYLPFNATSSYYSYLFNQTPSYLSTTSANTLPSGNTTWSVECWTWWNQAPAANWSFIVNQNTGGLQLLYQSSSSKFDIGAYGVADVLLSSVVSTSLLVNQWNHICYTSDGSNLRIFLNGTMIGYASSSYSFAAQTTVYIGSNDGGTTSTVNGYIEDLRVCNGSIPTSYQTASTTTGTKVFTPPSSPLTTTSQGAANVSLLTCQSSTIVDNSPTPKSLTNVGTVVPRNFAFDVNPFNDQSPAGNNWTPTNISLAYGSTMDSMVDVPTLTSANVANYAVMNPLNQSSNMSLTNGNLYVNAPNGSWSSVMATMRPSVGEKYYIEFYPATNVSPNNVMDVGLVAGGYAPTTGDPRSSMVTDFQNTGVNSGDVMALTIDRVNNEVKAYKNNTLVSTTSISATAAYDILLGTYQVSCSCNFGQQPFVYTPPSGFVPLNTFNL